MTIAKAVANLAADHAEQFRTQGLKWVQSDERARKLKELKDHELAKRMKARGDIAVAAAKRDVEATQEWADFLTEMVQARTQANRELIEVEYLHMKFFEKHGVRRALELLSGEST